MISKTEFKSLVEIVAFSAKKTQEQLATDMGYGKNYISEMLGPKGKVSDKFAKAFRRHFAEYLENPKNGNGNGDSTASQDNDGNGVTLKTLMAAQNALIKQMAVLSQTQTMLLTEIKTGVQEKVVTIDKDVKQVSSILSIQAKNIKTILLRTGFSHKEILMSLARLERNKDESVLVKRVDNQVVQAMIDEKKRGNKP